MKILAILWYLLLAALSLAALFGYDKFVWLPLGALYIHCASEIQDWWKR